MEIRINLQDYSPATAAAILVALSKACVGGEEKPTLVAATPKQSSANPSTPIEINLQEQADQTIPKEHISLETVRGAMHKYALAKGKPAAKAVLSAHGVNKLTDADEDVLDAIYSEVSA